MVLQMTNPEKTAAGAMTARLKGKGSFRLNGHIFEWAYDEADVLEVWNWQYGQSSEQLQGADKDRLARELALKLIDTREDSSNRKQRAQDHQHDD